MSERFDGKKVVPDKTTAGVIMSEELKKCPFCNSESRPNGYGYNVIRGFYLRGER